MLKINPEVKKAIMENRPVVALESTIISHGMPYPKNVETALAVERLLEITGQFLPLSVLSMVMQLWV